MTTDLARQEPVRWVAPMDEDDAAGALAHVLGSGDLYALSNAQRVAHYINLCRSLGLNPLSRPYQWIGFKESENSPAVLTLYFKPQAAAEVLRNNRVSVHFPRKEIVGELFVCEAHGTAPDGRLGVGTKYVPLTGKFGKLTGRYLANAFMAAESGALRRLAINMGFARVQIRRARHHANRVRRWHAPFSTIRLRSSATRPSTRKSPEPSASRRMRRPPRGDAEAVVDLPDQRPRPAEYDRRSRHQSAADAAPDAGAGPTPGSGPGSRR